jgi:hypothetical protein
MRELARTWKELFERAKGAPPWLRAPLRAGWHGWKRVRAALWPLSIFPRAVARSRLTKRVLGIYHFQEHAGFLGDMIEFLQILNILRVQHGLEKIDLCYIDDPSNPNRPISRQRVESSAAYKEMLLAVRAVLPGVGAVFQFDADAAFEKFFRSHTRQYVCWPEYHPLHSWPSLVDYTRISDRGFGYANTYAPIDRYFNDHGELPMLTCPPALLDWARAFFRENVAPAIPVALQVRFNPDSPLRNTKLDAWRGFLRRMEKRTDLKFIILSREEEILPELRSLKNVIYSKDHASGVLHDLALLQLSHVSMFPDAGLCTYPWFCGLPTIYFGVEKHEFPERRLQNEAGQGLRFLTPFQRRRFGDYTADTLESEFTALWRDLAAARWRNPYAAP